MTTATTNQTETPSEIIVHALQFLAGVCDGASALDGAGFNRMDTHFGHSLADQSQVRPLSPAQLRSALKILGKYTAQLASAGIILPAAPALEAQLTQANATPTATAPTPRPAGTLDYADGQVVVRFDYDPARVATVKQLRGQCGGQGWDPTTKVWRLNPTATTALIAAFPTFARTEAFASALAALEAQAREAQEEQDVERARVNSVVASLVDAAGDLTAPLPGGRTLFAHQQSGVKMLLESVGQYHGAILADEMGLGKSLEALVAAKAFGVRVFVVCPISLKDNWLREAEHVGVQIAVYSWAKLPEPPQTDYVLLCDEAHAMQTWGAYRYDEATGKVTLKGTRRTADAIRLATDAHCQAVYLLTGTPLKNGRPANLYPLLYAIRHPVAANKSAYERRYCAATATRWSRWDITGAAHLDELHAETRQAIVRRTKSECLDLPAKMRVFQPVDLSPEAERLFHQRLAEMMAEHDQRVAAKYTELLAELLDKGVDQADAEAQAEEQSTLGEALVSLTQYRLAGALAKTETALEMVREVTDGGRQVVVFTQFREAGERICDTLIREGVTVEMLSGDTKQAERDPMVQRFQHGATQVLVCMGAAGGVGITLTAAQTVILVDRPWTPGDAIQQEDRCIAEGQLVMTSAGLKPIETIQIGERVLTHLGHWGHVSARARREHRGLMTRLTYTRFSEPLECTHDHRVLLRRRDSLAVEWVQAHDVLPGDYLVMPRPPQGEPPCEVSLPAEAFTHGHAYQRLGADRFLGGRVTENTRHVALPERVTIDDDMLWLFGWYLAEGFTSTIGGKGRFVSLSGHQRERPILERLGATLARFGVSWHIYERQDTRGIELRAFSADLAEWFTAWFGHGSYDKHIPDVLMSLPSEQATVLLDGYVTGDGYQRKQQQEWVSISRELASQVTLLALRCGYAPTLRRVDGAANEGQWIGCYTMGGSPSSAALTQWDDQYVYEPVRQVETFFAPRPTYVYDLTVPEDGSFVVGQAAVHNCHRIGQQGTVTCYWLQYGPVDEKVDKILAQKAERIDLVLKGARKTMRGVSNPMAVARELWAEIAAQAAQK